VDDCYEFLLSIWTSRRRSATDLSILFGVTQRVARSADTFPMTNCGGVLKILIVWPSPHSRNPLQVQRIMHSLASGITHLLQAVPYYLSHNFKGPHIERLADTSRLNHCSLVTLCLRTSRISQKSMFMSSIWFTRWPRGLRRGSAAIRLMGLRAGIPPAIWMPVSRDCCV
jgi:hypothetical protein